MVGGRSSDHGVQIVGKGALALHMLLVLYVQVPVKSIVPWVMIPACRSSPLFMSLVERMAFDRQDESLCQSEDMAQDCSMKQTIGTNPCICYRKCPGILKAKTFLLLGGGGLGACRSLSHTCYKMLGAFMLFSLWFIHGASTSLVWWIYGCPVHAPFCAQEMWSLMQHHNPFEKKGAKVNLNRFMSAVKTGKEQESCWTFTSSGYLITCLDQGYFKGGRFQRHRGHSNQLQPHRFRYVL